MKDNYISTIPSSQIPFQLPDNWKWFRWSDLMISYQQGLIRSNRELGEGNVEYLKMGDLNGDGTASFDDLTKAEASVNEIEQYSLREGDFLINVRNSKELVGKTCIALELNNGPVLFNHMLVRIDHGNKDLNYFINAFYNIPTSKKLLNRVKQGTTTVIALYQRDLNDIPIPLPDQRTFESIVGLYKNLLNKISLNNRINAGLEDMAKTIYDYWFVQFDFPISAAQAASMGKPDKKGKPFKASGGRMVWSEELKREIPVGWEVKGIERYARFENGKGIGKDRLFEDGKYDVFGSNGIIGKTNDFLFEEPVIAIGRVGANYGEVNYSLNPCWISDNAITSQPVKGEYFWWLLLSLKGINYSSISGGSAQPLITQGQLRQLKFAIPDDSIFSHFHNVVESVYLKIHNHFQQNLRLTELRDWLLPMLMNGQIKIKDAERELAMAAEPVGVYKSK